MNIAKIGNVLSFNIDRDQQGLLTDISAQNNGSKLLLSIGDNEPILIRNPHSLAVVLAGNFELTVAESTSIANQLLTGLGIEVENNASTA
ncbi:hypothetical protein [Acinetobacter sp.]|uniref:hypothetical protein n=1 Tax=Acinetobacter sp. TaxID=472 RepID=UPI0031DB09B5